MIEDNTNRKQIKFDQALILGSIPLIWVAVEFIASGIYDYKKETINRKDLMGLLELFDILDKILVLF